MSIKQEQAQRDDGMRIALKGVMQQFSTTGQAAVSTDHPENNQSEIGDARDALSEAILDTARWRREKATQLPNDDRNLQAAELLERIVASVGDVPDNLMCRYAEAWHDETAMRTSETQSVLLRDIGFRSASDNATKLIEHLIARVDYAGADLIES